ncbi:AI-2E family transporter [Candidatus Pacearchaeota archaeon]|nr:AI-2E family transporter [Candidatus Pacearchaeota archaeon]
MKKEDGSFHKMLFWGSILLLLLLSYFIVKPFLIALASAFIVAYICRPLFLWFNKKLNASISALICIIVVILIILIPLTALTAGVVRQAYNTLSDQTVQQVLSSLSEYSLIKSLHLDLLQIKSTVLTFIIDAAGTAVAYLPSLILAVLVWIITLYYILLRWDALAATLENYLPFEHKREVAADIAAATKGMLHGTLLLALIQALIAGIAFFALGVDAYLLCASVIFVTAFVPAVGPGLVWVPLAIVYGFAGNYLQMSGIIIIGLFLGIYVDNVLRIKLVGRKTKIHPVIMLVGLLGGIMLFGLFGFIIGPLILYYTLKLIEEGSK